MAKKIFILSITYANSECGDSGLDAYPFSTLEKAQEAMNKDVENWKEDFKDELYKWEIQQRDEDVDCYEEGNYDANHYYWKIEEKEIDGDVKPWFIPNEEEENIN